MRYIFAVGDKVIVSVSHGENWTFAGQTGKVTEKLAPFNADKYEVKLDINGTTIQEFGSNLRSIYAK